VTARRQRFLRTRCGHCGAAKSRPSTTAYVYCDFCGSLCDYDFRKSCEQPMQMPGPVYEALAAQVQPAARAARAAGDRAAYGEIQHRLFDAWVTACPTAVPPRVGDPVYREAYVAHLAAAATLAAFDPDAHRVMTRVASATAALVWSHDRQGRPRVSSATFSHLLAAVIDQFDWSYSAATLSALPEHPDRAAPAVQRRMAASLFAQGWLPYLDERSAVAALKALDLEQAVVDAETHGTSIACGHCGAMLVQYPGAQRVVCERCGRAVRVDHRRNCDGCGNPLWLDGGADAVECAYCRQRLERIEIPWPLSPSRPG
jgi:LSD1 subclass zinc finger protein